jgi:hypothetical protein
MYNTDDYYYRMIFKHFVEKKFTFIENEELIKNIIAISKDKHNGNYMYLSKISSDENKEIIKKALQLQLSQSFSDDIFSPKVVMREYIEVDSFIHDYIKIIDKSIPSSFSLKADPFNSRALYFD